jgi:hypothetical protein
MKTLPLTLLLALGISLALLLGCTSSQFMREIPRTGQIARSNDAATIIFIRPSTWGASRTTIVDTKGRFLGDSLPGSFFAVSVPPGEHVFFSWAENTGPLKATVEAGKVYFVEVAPKMGMLSPRVHLLAVTPRQPTWSDIDKWLRESTPYAPDEPQGQAYLRERQEDVQERISRAVDAMAKLEGQDLEDRTIRPADGR